MSDNSDISDIIKTQRSLAIKAMHNPSHKFDHLYRIMCQEEWICTALEAVLSNKGARTAGIDGVTKKTFASEETRVLFTQQLRVELQEKQFRPVPVRRVHIPKANGKTRPLGIATLKDRVRPSSTNVVEDGAGTNLGERLSQLLKRLQAGAADDGLYRAPALLHQQPQ